MIAQRLAKIYLFDDGFRTSRGGGACNQGQGLGQHDGGFRGDILAVVKAREQGFDVCRSREAVVPGGSRQPVGIEVGLGKFGLPVFSGESWARKARGGGGGGAVRFPSAGWGASRAMELGRFSVSSLGASVEGSVGIALAMWQDQSTMSWESVIV
jgi:hypothetical protein